MKIEDTAIDNLEEIILNDTCMYYIFIYKDDENSNWDTALGMYKNKDDLVRDANNYYGRCYRGLIISIMLPNR